MLFPSWPKVLWMNSYSNTEPGQSNTFFILEHGIEYKERAMSAVMAEQSTNPDSNFTTPADVRQILKEELQGYFGPRGLESTGGAGGTSNLLPAAEAGSSGWSVNREIETISRTSRVETSIEYLGKQMVNGFTRMDKRFEELIHYLDKRFEQMDKRFEELIHHTDTRFQDLIHQMDKRFEQVDKRFEQVDKRFEQVDKRFSLIQWTIGIGFIMITVLMSVYQFLG